MGQKGKRTVDSIGVQVAILLVCLFLVERLTAARRRNRADGAGAPVVAWLAATALVLWAGGLVAFVVVHALLFTVGATAALAAAIVSVVALGAAPLALAVLIRRRGHPVTHG